MVQRITPQEVEVLKLPILNRRERLRRLGELAAPLKEGIPGLADIRVRSRFDLHLLALGRQAIDSTNGLLNDLRNNVERLNYTFNETGYPTDEAGATQHQINNLKDEEIINGKDF